MTLSNALAREPDQSSAQGVASYIPQFRDELVAVDADVVGLLEPCEARAMY